MSKDDKSTYYDAGGIETLDIIKAKLTPEQYEGYLLGNALKYQCRMNFKTPGSPQRDAEKAANYSRYLAEFLAEQSNSDTPAPSKPDLEPEEKTADDAPEGATHYRNEGGEIFYHNVESGILRYWIHEYGYWAVVNDPAKLELWSKELTPIT